MAVKTKILLPLDESLKRQVEDAAHTAGLTTTTFICRAIERALKTVPQPSRRIERGACPTFFKALCKEVRRGGLASKLGYAAAGRELMRHLADLIEADSQTEHNRKLAALGGLLARNDVDGVLSFFDAELPLCMQLVPRRRRSQFAAGVIEMAEQQGLT